jgi:hypothetical protein
MAALPPYFSQWESPSLVRAIVRGQILAREDPAWASSGAASPEEYEWWGRRMCGVACLRSLLAARGIDVPPSVPLAKELLAAGAYRRRDDGGLDGLIYAPFVAWLAAEHGIKGEVAAPLTLEDLTAAVEAGARVLASVSPRIRDATGPIASPGGHLVLVHGVTAAGVVLHNPSGDTPATQQNAVVGLDRFGQSFAGRGVIVR